jgi:hypothetical protein
MYLEEEYREYSCRLLESLYDAERRAREEEGSSGGRRSPEEEEEELEGAGCIPPHAAAIDGVGHHHGITGITCEAAV